MIYTTEVFLLEDCALELAEKISSSDIAQSYLINQYRVRTTDETKQKKTAFLKAKESFERIEAYGSHAPDFSEKRRTLRKAKRELDMDEAIADFRVSETSLQDILDHVGYEIASSISKDIKINAGNPFFEMAQKGCGGSCHVG